MKRANADIANWVIELHDGALKVQRAFQFADKADMASFLDFVGNFMKSPSMTVITSRTTKPAPVAFVCIEILPEQELLKAAGDIATTCEEEYASILSSAVKSAA
jgi:hypothetical protein